MILLASADCACRHPLQFVLPTGGTITIPTKLEAKEGLVNVQMPLAETCPR